MAVAAHPSPQQPIVDRTGRNPGPLSLTGVGILLAAFGILVATSEVLGLLLGDPDETTPAYLALHSLRVLMMVLALIAFAGLQAVYGGSGGRIRLLGFLLVASGFVLLFAVEFLFAYFVPFIAAEAPHVLEGLEAGTLSPPIPMIIAFVLVDLLLLTGGGLFFGSLLRRRSLPRAPLVTTMAAFLILAVSDFLPAPIHTMSVIVFGLAMVWLSLVVANGPKGTPVRGATEKVGPADVGSA